jgi:Domain of unknown function (DUF4331)
MALVPSIGTAPAHASSHREAPFITSMPKLDATDFYMFRSYEPNRSGYVTLIANYLPLQDPNGGPNYFELDSKGIYEIKIDNNGDGVEDVTFQFKFTNTIENLAVPVNGVNVPVALKQIGTIGKMGSPTDIGALNVHESYTLTVIRGGNRQAVTNVVGNNPVFEKPVDNIGFKTFPQYNLYAAAHVYNINIPGCSAGGRVFVGQRKDPFAIRRGTGVATLVDAPSRLIRSGATADMIRIPDDVQFEALLPSTCNQRESLSTISFFASGMSCGGAVALTRADFGYEVRVNWLTGRVEIVSRNAAD